MGKSNLGAPAPSLRPRAPAAVLTVRALAPPHVRSYPRLTAVCRPWSGNMTRETVHPLRSPCGSPRMPPEPRLGQVPGLIDQPGLWPSTGPRPSTSADIGYRWHARFIHRISMSALAQAWRTSLYPVSPAGWGRRRRPGCASFTWSDGAAIAPCQGRATPPLRPPLSGSAAAEEWNTMSHAKSGRIHEARPRPTLPVRRPPLPYG